MSRDKQIEEMARHCHFYEEGKCLLLEDEAVECDTKCDMCDFAKRLYNAGYRKASDVAREVTAEFKELVKQHLLSFGIYPVFVKNAMEYAESELKKKYTENKGE